MGKKVFVVDSALVNGDLKRYAGEEIDDASTALYALSNILYLLEKEKAEDHPEAATQVTQLKAVIQNLKEFIASEIMEEDEQVSVTLSAGKTDNVRRKEEDMPKKEDELVTRLNTIEADVKRLEGENKTLTDNVTRLEGENKTLKDNVTRLQEEGKTKDAEIKRLSEMPAEMPGTLKVVDKTADDLSRAKEAEKDAEELKRIEGLPQDQQALELVKRAHQNPQPIRLR